MGRSEPPARAVQAGGRLGDMKVLIIGNGAREHAIAWSVFTSKQKREILVAPGNSGTSALGINIDIDAEDIDGLLNLALNRRVDLTIVGPEAPLAAGIADRFADAGLRVFGPTAAAARIESSKSFAKDVMASAGVPTPRARAFSDMADALAYLRTAEPPFVVKADGLAAGRGVVMCPTRADAETALADMLENRAFGSAGDTILVEEWISGREISVFAFVDGCFVSEIASACDYKRVGDGDAGPNTGGMGSFSPPPFWSAELEATVRADILEPTARRMAEMGCPFQGVLYAGIMLTDEGPKVLEFNCRLGDPEAQVILPRLETDFAEIALATSEGRLAEIPPIRWSDDSWVGVVLASAGYPDAYETGFEIAGIPSPSAERVVFHAGARVGVGGETVTAGGRVATATARGDTIEDARREAYTLAREIRFANAYYRSDIAAGVPNSL